MGEAVKQDWEPDAVAPLRAFAAGYLTDAERLEVEVTVDLVVRLVRQEEMSHHFAEYLIGKLAEELVEEWIARQPT